MAQANPLDIANNMAVLANATVTIIEERSSPSGRGMCKFTGSSDAVEEKIEALFRKYPPDGYSTTVDFDETGTTATVSWWGCE